MENLVFLIWSSMKTIIKNDENHFWMEKENFVFNSKA